MRGGMLTRRAIGRPIRKTYPSSFLAITTRWIWLVPS